MIGSTVFVPFEEEVLVHTAVDVSVVAVTCDRCGDVRVSARRAVVYPESGEFRVDCPNCRGRIVRQLPEELVTALMAGGAEARKILPPLTIDDLLDFHDRIDDELRELMG